MPKVRISAARFGSILKNRNLTPADVAERVQTAVSPDELATSDMEVSLDDLLVLSRLFKRPWSYLLIDDAEAYPSAGSDNRTFDNRKVALSPDLLTELQAAELMLEAAAELFPGSGYTVPAVNGADTPAHRLAAETRALLSVSVDEQLAAKDEFAALRLWVAAIHGQGVYVAQRRLRDATIRAFSKVLGEQAVIVVDTGDTPYARIFSALHEYCHVTLRSTGICDLDDHSTVERYCNDVAAHVLLPGDLIDRVLTPNVFDGDGDAADDALRGMSRQLHVSQAVLLIRLRDHGTISQRTYESLELRRASRRSGRKPSGGQYYPPAINRVGRLYAHRVVDAVTDGAIDRQDASALLGVGEHLMPTYLAELAKGD
jgi:Zn-dependent peptidase ImmA (M78 family)